jgi:hypothetical protein
VKEKKKQETKEETGKKKREMRLKTVKCKQKKGQTIKMCKN